MQTSEFNGFVYDIEVEEDHSFVLACGLVAHNCELCLRLDGKRVKIGEAFYVNPKPGPYARVEFPPAHPHCFCTMQEIIE